MRGKPIDPEAKRLKGSEVPAAQISQRMKRPEAQRLQYHPAQRLRDAMAHTPKLKKAQRPQWSTSSLDSSLWVVISG